MLEDEQLDEIEELENNPFMEFKNYRTKKDPDNSPFPLEEDDPSCIRLGSGCSVGNMLIFTGGIRDYAMNKSIISNSSEVEDGEYLVVDNEGRYMFCRF